MKTLSKIFQALLGVVALTFAGLVAGGRLVWRKIRNRWKKASKWVRRTIVVSFLLIAAAFAALIAYAIYDDAKGRWYVDATLSKDVVVYYYADDTYRVYNTSTEKYTTPRISWVASAAENDSIGVYAIDDRRGFINTKTGDIVINAKSNDYEKAWVFSDGLAAVMKDGKVGFINVDNELVIPFQFDYSSNRWGDTGYLFHDGYCVMTNKDGKFGLIDISGNWVVEPEYDELWNAHKTGNRIVVNDGKHGVLDSCGNVVYPTEYFYIDIWEDGFVLTKDGRKWQEDYEGNIVNPFVIDGVNCYMKYPVSYSNENGVEYALSDYAEYFVNRNSGIMNRITGRPITPALFEDVNMISDKLFQVQDAETYDCYIIDVNGNRVN
ncbi:MAG: WG repeat-containing protein [Bacteroidales bacterium]|nr:WG repeat-containing protein [Bacteroidales bacterium]